MCLKKITDQQVVMLKEAGSPERAIMSSTASLQEAHEMERKQRDTEWTLRFESREQTIVN